MDGASEVISKPPPPPIILNGHVPHLDSDTNSGNTTAAAIPDNEPLTNPLGFSGTTVDTQDSSDSLNRMSLGSEVSLGVGLPELPFPLPDIDGTLINSEYSLTPSQLGSGDGNSETGFSFDSSVFNDDLVNSAIWSIGRDSGPLPNLAADDLDLEGQSEFSLESSSDSGASLPMPPEDNIGEVVPPKDGTGVASRENIGQVMPPVVTGAPYNNVVCMEDGFEDDFGTANPNPFVDSRGMDIDPFFDLARDRALSTITEGFEEEDEFSRPSSFNPSSIDSVLTAFAEANEFVRLNSDPNSQQCRLNSGWVNFDSSGAAETTVLSSDWSTQEDAPPTPTPTAPGRLEENIGSPASDGNQIGVSPETVEGGLTKPVRDSWQSISNEDDVINRKTPSSGTQTSDQHEASAKSAVIVSHVTSPTSDKVNPSDAKVTANLEVPPTLERISSPDSDASGEYMKLSDLHISPVSSVPPASVDQQVSSEVKKASGVETTQSPRSPSTAASEEHQSTASSGAVSESSESAHSTNMPKSDSHSSDAGRTGTGIAAIAGANAAVVVNASTQGSTDDSSTTSGGENRNVAPAVQDSEQENSQNQSSTSTESSTLNTSAQSQSQELLSDNDQTSSSLDTGDRSRTYSNLDRGTRESNLDSSNLDAGSRARKDRPSTPPSQQAASHPATNLPVLSPLSPEHGTELNQQYEFLRRTLSHSQRRYSQRRKQQGGSRRDPSPSGAPGGPGGRRYTSSAGSGGDVESRRKQTVGQLRDLLRNSENATTTTNHNREGWCVYVCTYM